MPDAYTPKHKRDMIAVAAAGPRLVGKREKRCEMVDFTPNGLKYCQSRAVARISESKSNWMYTDSFGSNPLLCQRHREEAYNMTGDGRLVELL